MNKEQDIEKLFQSSFENFEVSPPDDLKLKIDQKINFGEERRKRKYWLFGSVLVLVIVGISSLLLNFSTHKSHKVVSNSYKANTSIISENSQNSNDSFNRTNKNSNVLIKNQFDTTEFESDQIESDIKDQNIDKKPILTEHHDNESIDKNTQAYQSNTYSKSKKSTHIFEKKKEKNKQKSHSNQAKFVQSDRKMSQNDQKTRYSSKRKNRSKSNKSLSQIENGKDKAIFNPLINVYDDDVKENSEANKNIVSESPVNTKNVAKVVDSSTIVKAIENKTKRTKDIKKENSTKNKLPLLLSIKSGTSFPINTFSNANMNRVDESSSFQIQLEGVYSFKNNFGASTGFNYYQQDESYINTVETTKNTLTGYESIPTQHDSIFVDTAGISHTITIYDTIINPIYEQIKTSEEHKSSYSIQSFGLPFQLSFTQKLSNKLYLDLMTGGIVSFQKIKFADNSNPINKDLSMSKIGFKACLKTNLRYQFSQFGVSLNTNFSYDFSSTKFQTVARNRFLIDLGVGVHYQF